MNHKFYAITDRKLLPDQDLIPAIQKALNAGINMFQLREKDLSSGDLLRLGHTIAEITRAAGAQLFVNDRADIALAIGADGVHLRTSSYSPREAREFSRDLIIGASVHNSKEAQLKSEADFILFGPVFETPGKPEQGLEELKKVASSVSCPVYAVGGITPENAGQCFDAGAFGVAAIRSWLDPEAADEHMSFFAQL